MNLPHYNTVYVMFGLGPCGKTNFRANLLFDYMQDCQVYMADLEDSRIFLKDDKKVKDSTTDPLKSLLLAEAPETRRYRNIFIDDFVDETMISYEKCANTLVRGHNHWKNLFIICHFADDASRFVKILNKHFKSFIADREDLKINFSIKYLDFNNMEEDLL